MLELDVHLTKDNVVVVSHDQDLLRVTGQDLKIKECYFKNLPEIQDQGAVHVLNLLANRVSQQGNSTGFLNRVSQQGFSTEFLN